MALTTKRIIALPSQTDPQDGDYLAIDNATSGTHKIPVGRIGVEVDDTLTEQGKAADAKAVGDALDEIRSQVEVTGTASGAIATFADGSAMPAKSVIVNIEPVQSGSGTPSSSNVRPISGWSSVNVYVSPTEDEADGHTTTTSLGRTVYGGTLDVVSGVLTVTHAMATLNGTETWHIASDFAYTYPTGMKSGTAQTGWCSIAPTASSITAYGAMFGSGNTALYIGKALSTWNVSSVAEIQAYLANNPMQVVYPLATPQTYTLTGQEVSTLLGDNNVWADSGDVEVVYVRDLNIAINNLLNSNGTRSLGMMAMSAPTEEQTDEQTDEQTEEPSEDDMR